MLINYFNVTQLNRPDFVSAAILAKRSQDRSKSIHFFFYFSHILQATATPPQGQSPITTASKESKSSATSSETPPKVDLPRENPRVKQDDDSNKSSEENTSNPRKKIKK